MHLQCTNRRNDNNGIRFQTRIPAFEVPEFLVADVSAKAALRNMVVAQPRANLISDDGALANGNIGKGASVN